MRRTLACLLLLWWFLAYDFTPTVGVFPSDYRRGPAATPIVGFRFWVDCEDARAELVGANVFVLAGACREGEPSVSAEPIAVKGR